MWKSVIGSSSIMSFALLGDSLIYAILPVYAETFGLKFVMVGILLISIEIIVMGAIILLIFRGAMASLGPALIAQNINNDNKVKNDLSRMRTFRDLGAAIGPIVTGVTHSYFSPETQHSILGVTFTFFFLFFLNSNTFEESI